MSKSKVSRIGSLSDKEFIALLKESGTQADAMRRLGYLAFSSSYPALRKRIAELGLTEYFENKSKKFISDQKRTLGLQKGRPLVDILNLSSGRLQSGHRKRIIREGLLGKYACSECGISSWNSKYIVLQIDHVNGNPYDHRLENLRLLCPNCHSQTETYGNKITESVKEMRKQQASVLMSGNLNRKKHTKRVDVFCLDCQVKINHRSLRCLSCAQKQKNTGGRRPSRDQLAADIELMNWSALGRKYGVSDNAVRKWAKHYNLPHNKKSLFQDRLIGMALASGASG